jgi:AraC-like DNA-binding protein
VYAAIARIEEDAAIGVSLRDLARVAGTTPFQFLRLFKRETGVTPHRLLLRARLRRAVELLRATRAPVTEIALEVGFADLSNFINSFRRQVGCSPLRFRKQSAADLASRVLAAPLT